MAPGTTRRSLFHGVALALLPAALSAQPPPRPRVALPERPTIATHAWTVEPAIFEVETGVEWDRNPDASHTLWTPTLLKIGIAPRTQLGFQASLSSQTAVGAQPRVPLGLGDVAIVLKQRLVDSLPVLGAFAIIPNVKFPTGGVDRGTGTTDWSLLLVSSNQFGPVSLDVNLGYTRRSGDGTLAPKNATLWTISTGTTITGPLGLALELFGLPATSGPAGDRGAVAILTGPTLAVRPWWILDLGAIVHLTGPQPDALYAGMTYNFGRD